MATTASRALSRSASKQDIKSSKPSSAQSSKPADYVYFDRTTAAFSDDAVPRAKAAQLKLEHYYKVAVDAAIERNTRFFSSPRYSCGTIYCSFPDALSSRDGCNLTLCYLMSGSNGSSCNTERRSLPISGFVVRSWGLTISGRSRSLARVLSERLVKTHGSFTISPSYTTPPRSD